MHFSKLNTFIVKFVFTALLMVSFEINAQIVADFTVIESEGCAPFVAQFQDLSNGAITYRYWEFGNTNTSNTNNIIPSASYHSPGYYTVTLTVSDGVDTASVTKVDFIRVLALPIANFNNQTILTGCASFPFSVTDNSTDGDLPITNWTWDFDDGTGQVSGQNINHMFQSPGTFSVTLIVSDSMGCSDSFVKSNLVSVLPKPQANFTSNDTLTACGPPLSVNIFNTSTSVTPLTFQWTVGGIGYTTTHVTPTFITSGGFDAQLIATNTIGCSDTITIPNYIWIGSIVASMNAPDTFCLNAPSDLINTSFGGDVFSWNFGDGFTDTGDTVTHTYTANGSYTVTLISSSGSTCDDTTTKVIEVESIQAAFTSTPNFSCQIPLVVNFTDQTVGNIVFWEWRFGNPSAALPPAISNISNAQNPTNTYESAGTFDDTLLVRNSNGCESTLIKPANEEIIITQANFSASEIDGCVPLDVDFTNFTSPFNRMVKNWWDFDDGSPIDSSLSPSHTFVNVGEYDVTLYVVSIMGCTTSFFTTIKVGSIQTANFMLDTLVACGSDTIMFTNMSSDTSLLDEYLWFFGDGDQSSDYEPFHVYNDTGYMDVTLIASYNGCIDTLTIDSAIRIFGPIGSFSPVYNCDTPNVVTFNPDSYGGTSFSWDFGDSTSLDSLNWNTSHQFAALDSNYDITLFLYDSLTGCRDTVRDNIHVMFIEGNLVAGDTTICRYNKVIFNTGSSINALSSVKWAMNNVNAQSAGLSNKEYMFPILGPHTIYAVVMDAHACLDTVSQDVYVYEPQINLNISPTSGCAPLVVQLTDLSTSDTNLVFWRWDFGNGNVVNGPNPTRTFNGNTTTIYDLTLTVIDTFGCRNDLDSIAAITVIEPPSYFEASDVEVCEYENVLFTNHPIGTYTYFWDFGDGFTSTSATPSHDYITGVFDVSLKVTDATGCDSTFVRPSYIDVQVTPIAKFTANPIIVDCYPANITFTDTSNYPFMDHWTWNFGDSPNFVVTYNPTAQNLYNLPGNYDVTLILVSTYGCTDTIVKPNFITIGGPTGTIVSNPLIGCKYQNVNFDVVNINVDAQRFVWDFGDGNVDTTYYPNLAIDHVYPNPGFYNVSLILSDLQGACAKVDTATMEIDLVEADFLLSDTNGCAPYDFGVVNNSIGEDTLKWFLDGALFPGALVPTFSITQPGLHHITLQVISDYSQCKDTITKDVRVFPIPNLNLGPDAVVCIGDSIQLKASGANTYSWTPNLWLDNDTLRNPVSIPQSNIIYAVFGTDTNNCENTDSVNITVQQIPILTWITPDTSIFLGTDIQLETSANMPITYHWTPKRTMGCTDCPNPIVEPKDSTLYILHYGDLNNCFVLDTNVFVKVIDEFDVFIPNAFSPDGDDLNDTFFPVMYGVEEFLYMRIYDRWGMMVYETKDLGLGWDGRVDGEISNYNSVYSYQISVKRYTDEIKDYTGMVVLLTK